ncbi:MAG: transcription termination factor NusA [Candidatus Yanofskybacteria bacterium]|nr:transcription termination factor NusA [Candidatus Yanofskybacteria bacterium]
MDLKNLPLLLSQISEEKGLSAERVLEAIEQALAAAYKKDYGKRGQLIKAKFNSQTGNADFWQEKTVVDDTMIYSEQELEELKEQERLPSEDEEISAEKKVRFNPERHLFEEEAKKLKPDAQPGDIVQIPLERNMNYGRIAAQTAKQVILQKIREAERESTLKEFKSKEGGLISGVIQRVEGRAIFVDLGKVLGVFPREEHVPGEFYRPGQRLRFYVSQVEDTPKGPSIILSRAYPKFISRLFALEVPEIAAETVVIKAIAREPGARTKVAVASTEPQVDPVGAMVGQRGTRVSAVINELGGEKIDIIEWAEDTETFIANALSPAKVLQVETYPKNRALAIVPEDQLSLAIGKEGQNVRLAAKLTGWKIDVRTPEGTQVDMPAESQDDAQEEAEKEKPANI